MRLYYDLHIHTALSPCSDNDMSPINIINMSLLKGLDIIAITDHNSTSNCLPCMKAAKNKDIIVIPGIELQTREEVHLLCFFRSYEASSKFDRIVRNKMLNNLNQPDFFGKQILFDENNNIIGDEKRLLITSVDLSLSQVFKLVLKLNGAVIPAHIDKKNFSIISNLGFIPLDLEVKTIEISKSCDLESFKLKNRFINNYKIIRNSDAHYLGDISERDNYIETYSKSIDSVINYLQYNNSL